MRLGRQSTDTIASETRGGLTQHGTSMSGFKYPDHNDRRSAADVARKAVLERMKTRVIPGHPDFEKVQAERVRAAADREERLKTAREDKIRRAVEEKVAKEVAYQTQLKAERAAYQAKMAAEKDLMASQKVARDARYAARKARTGKK
jgi:Family of unknown function (DUF6481)